MFTILMLAKVSTCSFQLSTVGVSFDFQALGEKVKRVQIQKKTPEMFPDDTRLLDMLFATVCDSYQPFMFMLETDIVLLQVTLIF